MKKILIIEDDPIATHVYATLMRKNGYQVEVATDGSNGWNRVQELKPDGLLLDLMMPRVNGVQLLKQIRASDAFKHLPVMVFTNVFIPALVAEAVDAGATKVFNKSTLTPLMLAEAFSQAFTPQNSKTVAA